MAGAIARIGNGEVSAVIELSKKQFYQMRKHAGICVDCGQEDAYTMAGRARCAECAERCRANQERYLKCLECTLRQRKANAKNRGRHPRLDGMCWQCNKMEPIPGKKPCQNCYPGALKKLEKANRVRIEKEIYPYWSDKGKGGGQCRDLGNGR